MARISGGCRCLPAIGLSRRHWQAGSSRSGLEGVMARRLQKNLFKNTPQTKLEKVLCLGRSLPVRARPTHPDTLSGGVRGCYSRHPWRAARVIFSSESRCFILVSGGSFRPRGSSLKDIPFFLSGKRQLKQSQRPVSVSYSTPSRNSF